MSVFITPDKYLVNKQTNVRCQLFNVRGYEDRIQFLSDLFKTRVTPYFGDSSDDLRAIKSKDDWRARILCDGGEPVAVVIFRTVLVDDDYIGKTVQIKHLFTVDPKHEGLGYEKTLLDYAKGLIQSLLSRLPDISISTCDREVKALEAFKKEGFKVSKELKDFNVKGVTQIYLKLKGASSQATNSSSPSGSRGVKIDLPTTEEPTYKRKREEDHEPRQREARVERIPLKGIYIWQMQSGTKTVEVRIDSGKFRRIVSGSIIEFHNQNDSVRCKVTETVRYKSFRETLTAEGLERCLPGCKSLEDGVRLYDSIPGYADKARQHGVLAIRLELVKN